MYVRTIKGVDYHLYENEKEFRKKHKEAPIKEDWREAEEGEWAFSDDGQVLTIIKKLTINSKEFGKGSSYVRTLLGMKVVGNTAKLKGEPVKDIYRFGSLKRKFITTSERLFCKYVAEGMDTIEAYLTAFKTKKEEYALERSKILLRQKRIQNMVNKEVEELMDELGISKTYLLEAVKGIIDKAGARDSDKLRALENLMKISGMLSTEKKTDSIALIQEFKGFSKDKLKAFETGLLEENVS